MHALRIERIADHLDLIGTIASWHWNAWSRGEVDGSLASWTSGLRGRTHRDRIPTTYVALDGEELVGSVTLVEHDMAIHREWSPWLAGVYVRSDRRRQGIGSTLVRHAVGAAATMGVSRLYLYTETAPGFYERLGWRPIAEEEYLGQPVTIMAIDTGVEVSGGRDAARASP
jgi:GNAT superfamily N-acetyltransferase